MHTAGPRASAGARASAVRGVGPTWPAFMFHATPFAGRELLGVPGLSMLGVVGAVAGAADDELAVHHARLDHTYCRGFWRVGEQTRV